VNKKYKLALALGGGGARGLAHIGVLKVLERENIKFDLIVGTSMGAIIGAMYTQLPDAEAIETKALSFLDEFLEGKQWIKTLDPGLSADKPSLLTELSQYVQRRYLTLKALTRIALEPKESLYEPLKSVILDNNIEDNEIPFTAVSIDIVNGKPIVLSRGSIIDAVYASAAIEGVFPPLEYDGGLLSDGGPVNITPVEVALNLGARKVIAVDVFQKIRRVDKFVNGLEIIMRGDNIGLNRLRQIELAMADIVIYPEVSAIHWASFGRASECIELGRKAAEIKMPEIRKLLSRFAWLSKITGSWKSRSDNM